MAHSAPKLDFVIVGASIAGLASAIALKRAGHNVLVLDKSTHLGQGSSVPSGCARIPPNGSKILFDWGLERKIRKSATVVERFAVYRYEGKGEGHDLMGIQRWDPEFLSEARGNFLHFRYQDLVRILHDEAIRSLEMADCPGTWPPPRVEVRFGAEVVGIDGDACAVRLASGEALKGDAIIGADGARGVVRRMLMQEEGAEASQDDIRTNHVVYEAVVPKSLAAKDPNVTSFLEYTQSAFMGNNRGAMALTFGQEQDISLCVFAPTDADKDEILEILGPCDPGIRTLASLAGPFKRAKIQEPYQLQSWVSASGRVLALGEAAHPLPPTSVHTYSIALEDSAFIGEIFTHTRDRSRVSEFLNAFQEHREARCARIRAIEMQYIWGGFLLPDGEVQAMRDGLMRANLAAGRNAMDMPPGHYAAKAMEETEMVFGYEPADDAGEWWMAWGRYRESKSVAPADEGEENLDMQWNSFSAIKIEDDVDVASGETV